MRARRWTARPVKYIQKRVRVGSGQGCSHPRKAWRHVLRSDFSIHRRRRTGLAGRCALAGGTQELAHRNVGRRPRTHDSVCDEEDRVMAKRSVSSARGRRVAKNGRRTRDEKIDFSDIPELTDSQLAHARRVGRPPLGRAARELIAIRIDPDVLRSLRVEATRKSIGYQTLIHQLLAAHVRRSA